MPNSKARFIILKIVIAVGIPLPLEFVVLIRLAIFQVKMMV